jgi:hypothetical protein
VAIDVSTRPFSSLETAFDSAWTVATVLKGEPAACKTTVVIIDEINQSRFESDELGMWTPGHFNMRSILDQYYRFAYADSTRNGD